MTEGAFTGWLEDHLVDLETLVRGREVSPGSTILPTLTIGVGQIDLAEELLSDRDSIVVLQRTLGEGGMGIVRLGTQTSLGRAVAVKSLQPKLHTPAGIAKLVQEAWVTGFLEHPNIVPVYDLALDGAGHPMLVMRRIEGVPWGALMGDDAAVRERFGVADPLHWHLRVLMQLASALQFAHSRKILHLDLKPDNVMIGPLGEVYLVDWGLAMSLEENGRLAAARSNSELIGTPAYLAPEMLSGDGAWLGTHTDVYLLGSTLYALLAGRPPHAGDTLMAVLFQAVQGTSEPLPAWIPAELADVVHTAMQPNPTNRYPTAEAFRLAVQDFLEHRGALELVKQADARRADLEGLIAAQESDGLVAAVSAARFGYAQALAAWPECAAARDGLERATSRYARWCAEHDDLRTAEDLAAQLTQSWPEMDAAIAAARERHRIEQERLEALERLRHDLDARTGQGSRLGVLAAILVTWAVLPLVGSRFEGFVSYPVFVGVSVSSLLVLGILITVARDALLATQVNRRGMATLVLMLLAQLLGTLGAWHHGLELSIAGAMLFPMWSLCAATFALTVESRLWPSAIVYAVGAVLVMIRPDIWVVASVACNSTVLINAVTVWRPSASVPRSAE